MKSMIAEFDKRLNPEVKELNFDCRTTKDSTFMNVTRCAIFEYLCHHPCSTATMVARRIKISESTVRWHLRKLMKEKFVSADENGNTVFFPLNMIWPDHIDIFRLLAWAKARTILALICSRNGISQKELSMELNLNARTVTRYTSGFEEVGLIERLNDGKHKRYFPAKRISELRRYYTKRARHFKGYLLRRVKQDGTKPEILLSTSGFLRLKLAAGRKRIVLSLPMTPFGGEVFRLGSIKVGSSPKNAMQVPIPQAPKSAVHTVKVQT